MKTEIIKQIHNTQENALVVENYPYGFRLRTQIKYWVETTNKGDRFCSVTLNPKTNKWNTPKKSTYSDVVVLTKSLENGYIDSKTWQVDYTSLEDLEKFLSFCEGFNFNDSQLKKIAIGKAVYKTREFIFIEIVPTDRDTESEEHKQEQEKVKRSIQALHNIHLRAEGVI